MVHSPCVQLRKSEAFFGLNPYSSWNGVYPVDEFPLGASTQPKMVLLEFGQIVCGSTATDYIIAWYIQTFVSYIVRHLSWFSNH